MSSHIAVDVGGTQLRAGCYPENSLDPSNFSRIPTRDPNSSPLERLKDLVASVWPDDDTVASIGVAAPGPLDPYQGIVMAAPNIPGWVDLPLRQELEKRFSVPVTLGNDANLAALGEWRFGAGQGHKHLVYLTISTGIGGGVIMNNHLLLGRRGLAAELGHVSIMEDGPLCGCGQHGHLEAVSSGTAIAHWFENQIRQGAESSLSIDEAITSKSIAKAAKHGDRLAIAAFERAGKYLGRALADYLHIFNPSIVIFGGGVSYSGDLLFEPMRASLREHVLSPHYLEDLTITTAALGDKSGLIGALVLARQLSEKFDGTAPAHRPARELREPS